ncbi:MAG: LPXTG cell wall anchor domain-containing protein [Ancrocorticia sp.]|nr:LPXTG cell wall anchor domain-containing protein [Ancrocorticia sp.]MCI2193124.1 LPXTG cell wall anchor domain-containing protein [Ancrocorticia sp.]
MLQFVVGGGSGQILSANGTALQVADTSTAFSLGSSVSGITAFPAEQGTGRYYVVWSTATTSAAGSLQYVIVDMTKSDGVGQVLSAATNLATGDASMAVTSVPNADGTGYWVINPKRGTAVINSYLFSSSGTVGTAVDSTVGTAVTGGKVKYEDIRFSSDFSSVAALASNGSTSRVRVMSIDAATGVLSLKSSDNADNQLTNQSGALSLEFSPNSSYLYVASSTSVYRYSVNNSTGALTSPTSSATTTGSIGGQLRLGTDGKLYWAQNNSQTLKVLADPNGTSGNWTTQALASGSTSALGLSGTLTDCGIALTSFLVQKNNSEGESVSGSTFALYSNSNGAAGDAVSDSLPAVSQGGAVGLFQADNLAPGTYWLRETRAPTGHTLLAKDVRVVIATDGTITLQANTNPQVALSGNVTDGYKITVTDTAAIELPLTGGQWTRLVTVGGAVLLVLALVGTVVWRRRRNRIARSESPRGGGTL